MNDSLYFEDERGPPPHFAGRHQELTAFHAKLQRLCAVGHTTSGLQLTVGVPGSGKTQLALRFAKDTAGSQVEGRSVSVLMAPPEVLNDPASLFLSMATEIGREQAAREIAEVDDKLSNVSVKAGGFGGSATRDVGRYTAAFSRLLHKSSQRGMWDGRALILIIDELQRVDDEGMKPLCVLHGGTHNCPILLMGFGLSHTATVLDDRDTSRSISRLAGATVLAPLSCDEAYEALSQGLAHYGHHDVPADSLISLVKASHSFPQHIHGYLEGARQSLMTWGHLEGEPLQAALRHGHKRRVQYYEERLEMSQSHEPVMAVVRAMQSAKTDALPLRVARNAVRDDGFDDDVLAKAVNHGALVCRGGRIFFGIPSFRSYVNELLEQHRGGVDV